MMFFVWEWIAIWSCLSLFFLEYSAQIPGQMSLDKPTFYITSVRYVLLHLCSYHGYYVVNWAAQAHGSFPYPQGYIFFCLQRLRPAFCLGKLVLVSIASEWTRLPFTFPEASLTSAGSNSSSCRAFLLSKTQHFPLKVPFICDQLGSPSLCLCECGAMILVFR